MRLRPSLIVAAVVAVGLVLLGFWMVVAGWPLRTPTQEALLDLAQLPMAGAVLVGVAEMTWTRRLWVRSRRTFLAVFGPAMAALVIGLVLVVATYAANAKNLLGPGLLLVWLGVGLAFTYLAIDSLRREVSTNRSLLRTEAIGDEDEGDDYLADWDDDTDEDDEDDDHDPTGGTHR